jgi:hypothetical protein
LAKGKKPANGGLLNDIEVKISRDRTGWLGREESNLRMAESKSDQFANNINAHSKKISKFAPFRINRLAVDSECGRA